MIIFTKTLTTSIAVCLSELLVPVSVNQQLIKYESPIVHSPLKTNIDFVNEQLEETTYLIISNELMRQ